MASLMSSALLATQESYALMLERLSVESRLLLDQSDHSLELRFVLDGTMGSDGGGADGGGVLLRHCDVRYDFLHMSQKEIMSDPSSIAPFNLIPYLKQP
jgi:hypothetical protein